MIEAFKKTFPNLEFTQLPNGLSVKKNYVTLTLDMSDIKEAQNSLQFFISILLKCFDKTRDYEKTLGELLSNLKSVS